MVIKAWFDALTAKQARMAAILSIEGKKRGIDVIITCRKYDYVEEVLNAFGLRYECVGYHGESTREKLLRGIERQLALLDVVRDFDVHISLTSPDAVRVAFGLGKPIIALTDTAHSYFVNKLTLPLANTVIVPSAIPMSEWARYIPSAEIDKVRAFDGVFELMWINRFKPSGDSINRLGLKSKEFAVIRFEESRASYYDYGDKSRLLIKMTRNILENGYYVVMFPRYPHQEELIRTELGLFLKLGKLIVPRNTMLDGLDLAWHARLVITGGSTMAHEAALLGIPAISYFPQHYYIDDYLMGKGLPLYRCVAEDCLGILNSILKQIRPMLIQIP
ncbi:DUF354 domain-containing protein [Vulcanisaeta sp. JCM 16159]|uniref:DUF354 domain-containing protein n=1 Tax=Vulcanisaeta sp. JCM 16159 TaxID=1295371 RepID=UPI000ABFC911|nr:DUF354 domain-containing protein [Vulcanisaeta sp. JCM 16159]